MNKPKSNNPLGGGIAVAIGAIAGGLIGARNGQPSLGLLIGVGAGSLIAGLVSLFDRKF